MKKLVNWPEKAKISVVSALLSVFTAVAFHVPFFKHVLANVSDGANGVLIVVGLGIILLVGNYLLYYLLLWAGRFVGKCIIALSLVFDAVALYFINTYDVIIDESMMGNVFNTRYSEASAYFSIDALLYLLQGLLPAIYLFARKIDYGCAKRFFANIGVSLGIVAAVAFGNMTNWPWIDRNSTVLGSLLLPWSYTINTFRHHAIVKERNREEILLPDASFKDPDTKQVFILMIGESARRDHFSLYGYSRETNPLLKGDDIKIYPAESAATYTTGGVKAILDYTPTDELYELLPNYLFRTGADVMWRTSNWGEPPLHIDTYLEKKDLAQMYPDADADHDEILLTGLQEKILSSEKKKIFIVLHTSTSHGPTYNKQYPKPFEVFTPICNTVEMSSADHDELMNSYDNTILYTDFLIHSAIETLKGLPEDYETGLIYVSDHGESLGEGNLYMHGIPMALAPKEQVEIPFIAWSSAREFREMEAASQYHVFHSVLDFFNVSSEIADKEKTIFK